MAKVTVLNPRGYAPKITARGLAPQLDGLASKTVYLVDVGFENCDVFMHQMQGWLGEHEPQLRTEVVRWRRPARTGSRAL